MYDVNFGAWACSVLMVALGCCSDSMTLCEMEAWFRSNALQDGNGVYLKEA